jgi:HD-like signal output (HDOD) protein
MQLIDRMPEPPKASIQAINMLEDPDVPVSKAANFISMDETLTVKLLKLANSSFYGFQGKVTTAKDAVIRLGANVVKSALYTAMLEGGGISPNPFFFELWKSSLFTALAAKDVGVMFESNRRDLCFTSGILCDVGQILLNEAMPDIYPGLIQMSREKGIEVSAAEQKVFGYTHAQVATRLADNWKLPMIYQNSIRYHHNPSGAIKQVLPEDMKVICATHTANLLSPLFCTDVTQAPIDFAFFADQGITRKPSDIILNQISLKFEGYFKEIMQVANAMFDTGTTAGARK